jgi:hypothetical protein
VFGLRTALLLLALVAGIVGAAGAVSALPVAVGPVSCSVTGTAVGVASGVPPTVTVTPPTVDCTLPV